MRYLARLYLIGFSGQLEVDLSGISCFDRAFPHTSPVVSGGFQIRLETIEGPASPVGLKFHYWLLNSQACRLLSSLRIWPPIAKLPGSSLTGEPLGNSASASKNSGGIGAEYVLVIVLTRSIGQSMAHEYIQGHRHIGIWRETRRDCTRHPTSQYPFHRLFRRHISNPINSRSHAPTRQGRYTRQLHGMRGENGEQMENHAFLPQTLP